jgi:anti-sigma factor RsiW
MRPDRMVLSAYLDGELPDRFVAKVERAVANDPRVRDDYDRLLRLRHRLDVDSSIDVDESARRSRDAIEERIRGLEPRPALWFRRVSLPVPAVAAAAAVLVALFVALALRLLPSTPAQDVLTGANDVDVTIRVDGSNMEHVLQWLVDRNKLGEVNIQLPEQRFQIVGEPQLVKPAQYAGESGQ